MDLSKREKTGLLVFVFIIITILSIMYYKGKNSSVEVIKNNKEISETEMEVKTKDSSIKVFIRGEVKKPDVYVLQAEDRMEKLVLMAGGFTENADQNAINLAKKLKDEEFIIVPTLNPGTVLPSTASPFPASSGKVNINTASLSELKTLDGIGDTLAQRIIDYRTKNGFFGDVKDLKKVSGIGDSRYKAIEDKITVY